MESLKNSMPLISIILPFFNRINLTINALKSILNQTYSNYEILLIDDGSSDDLAEIMELIKKNEKIRYFSNLLNLGCSCSRNIGINNAHGKYIAFLDSDDLFVPEKLMTQVAMMEENNLIFTHTSYWRVESGINKPKFIKSGRYNYTYPFIAFHCLIAMPTVMIRRDFLQDRRFLEEYRFGEDGIFWLELSRYTRLLGINKPLSIVNISINTTGRSKLKLKTARIQIAAQLANYNLPFYYLFRLYNGFRNFFDV